MKGKPIKEILLVYLLLYAISWFIFGQLGYFHSLLSQWLVGAIPLVLLLTLPILIILKRKRGWSSLGIISKNFSHSIALGGASGLIIVIVHRLIWPNHYYATLLNLPLAIIFWAFLATSQEVFFRGYLQSSFSKMFGNIPGLIFTSILFALWHTSLWSSPSWSSFSILSRMFLISLVWGFSFQKTKNLLAPWLSHLIVGVGLSNF